MQRNITTTKATYLVRGEGRELVEKEMTLIGEFDNDTALKKVQKKTSEKVYEVINCEVKTQLYKCDDDAFLAIAHPVVKTEKEDN